MQTPIFPIYPAEKNPHIVQQIQTQLHNSGFDNVPQSGIYERETYIALRAFQASHNDASGQPLTVDGIIGAKTWQALFNPSSPLVHPPSSPLQIKAIEYASIEVGAVESPLGSNRGPRVEQYLKSVNCPVGSPWCAAFVYWCFAQAAFYHCTINPLPKTAHCLTHWHTTNGHRIPSTDALPARLPSSEALPVPIPSPFGGGSGWGSLIKPGSIFIINHGGGKGHTGIITQINGHTITTIEGNTNHNHSREGIGVFQHTRQLSEINTGFINYC